MPTSRKRWLRFRGLKAKSNIALEGNSPATGGKVLSFSESGVISIRISEESVGGDSLLWLYYLQFDPAGGGEGCEYTMYSDSSIKPPVLKGRRTETVDPPVLLDVITPAFAFFVRPWAEVGMVAYL